jgi:hypothetical protein
MEENDISSDLTFVDIQFGTPNTNNDDPHTNTINDDMNVEENSSNSIPADDLIPVTALSDQPVEVEEPTPLTFAPPVVSFDNTSPGISSPDFQTTSRYQTRSRTGSYFAPVEFNQSLLIMSTT